MEFKTLPKELLALLTNIASLISKVKECEESWAKISGMFSMENEELSQEHHFGSGYRALHVASNAILRSIQKTVTVHEANAHDLAESMRAIGAIEKESTAWDSIRKISEATHGQLSSLSADLLSSFSSSITKADFVSLEDPMTRNSFNFKLAAWRRQIEEEQRKISDEAQLKLVDPMKEIAIFFTSSLIPMALERRDHLRSEDAFLEELLSILTSASDAVTSDKKLTLISTMKASEHRSAAPLEKGSLITSPNDSEVILSGFLRLKKSSLFSTGWPISFLVLTYTPSCSSSYLHILPLDKSVIFSILNREPWSSSTSTFKPVSSFQKWEDPQLPSQVSSYLLRKYFYREYEPGSSAAAPRFNSFCAQVAFPPGTLSLPMRRRGERKECFVVSALVTSSSDTLLLKVAASSSMLTSLELRAVSVLNNPTPNEWLCVINDTVHISLSEKSSMGSGRHSPIEGNVITNTATSYHEGIYKYHDNQEMMTSPSFEGEKPLYPHFGSRETLAEDDGWSVELSDLSMNNENEDDPTEAHSANESSMFSMSSNSLATTSHTSYFSEQFSASDTRSKWTSSLIDDPWRSS